MRNILMLEKHDVFFWHSSGSVSGVLPSAYIIWCGLQQAERQARTEGDHWGRVQMDPQQDVRGSINIAYGSGPRSNWIVWNESWASLVLSPQKLRTRVWSGVLNGPKEPTEDHGSLLITMNITDTRKLRFGVTWDGYRESSVRRVCRYVWRTQLMRVLIYTKACTKWRPRSPFPFYWLSLFPPPPTNTSIR